MKHLLRLRNFHVVVRIDFASLAAISLNQYTTATTRCAILWVQTLNQIQPLLFALRREDAVLDFGVCMASVFSVNLARTATRMERRILLARDNACLDTIVQRDPPTLRKSNAAMLVVSVLDLATGAPRQ